MIKALSAGTANPSFRHTILPRRLYARPFGLQSRCLQEGDHFPIERRIAIEEGISIRTRFRECFAQLLDDPFRRRVVSHIETQNPAPPVLDHKKAVEQMECHRRHCEKVERCNHFTMVLYERQPVLRGIAATPHATQISSHTPLRDDETELLKFTVDLGGSPTMVLLRQSPDQNANLLGDLRWSAAWPGSPAPIETESGAVPADHGVGFHQDQDVGPAGPTP